MAEWPFATTRLRGCSSSPCAFGSTATARSVGAGAQIEARDGNPEPFAVRALHQVRAFHRPFERTDHTVAAVLVIRARLNNGLFSDHALPLDLLEVPTGIADVPVAAEQLNFVVALVGNPHQIPEHKAAAHHVGLLIEIDRADGNGDRVGYGGVRDHDFITTIYGILGRRHLPGVRSANIAADQRRLDVYSGQGRK